MRLLILTPIFTPATGGAATYYSLLAECLLQRGFVKTITIVTEQMPGEPDDSLANQDRLRIIRKFPFRAGGEVNGMRKYIRYGMQNLQYLALPRIIAESQADVVLIHSSFHNFVNLLQIVTARVSRRATVIADVRDHQLPVGKLTQLRRYDRIIVCSENVRAHLMKLPELASRIVHLPVIQERDFADAISEGPEQARRYGLVPGRFLLYSGLLKEDKGVDLLLAAYVRYRAKGHTDPLVLVGTVRDQSLSDKAKSVEDVRLMPPLPRRSLLALMSQASLCINLSRSEGMPRTSLEAIALGVSALLPVGIPEFEKYCPAAVAAGTQPQAIADQIERLQRRAISGAYPLSCHSPAEVIPAYENLFADALRNRIVLGARTAGDTALSP